MSIPNIQNSVMGVTVRGANARRIVNSTASAGRTVGKPALFQVRVTPDGQGTVSIDVWLPKQIGGVVRRNGWPVRPQYAPVAEEGEWYNIASAHEVSATEKQVVVRVMYDEPMLAKPTGWEGDLYWKLSIEAAAALDIAEIRDKHETPVVLATIKDGVLLQQLHTGVISTAYQPPPQWQCTIEADRDGDPALFVGSGRLAWGGTHNATWPGRQIALDMMPGQKRFVLWVTRCAPIPHEACLDAVPGCAEITAKDPTAFVPDVGAVEVHASAARQAGWTDAHLLAVIERGEDGAYAIDQVQVAEIAVNAVVYPGETPADPTPEEEGENECGLSDFPSNIDDSSTPWRDFPVGWGELGIRFPSKVSACW